MVIIEKFGTGFPDDIHKLIFPCVRLRERWGGTARPRRKVEGRNGDKRRN